MSSIYTIENFNAKNEYMKMFEFKTSASIIIKKSIIHFAINNIDRNASLFLLATLVGFNNASNIEQGIIEYTLIRVSNMCPDIPEFAINIYDNKVSDIYNNLDVKNVRINNKTLYSAVINHDIDPYYLAFMRPEQLHPSAWAKELERRNVIEETNNTHHVSTLYKCYKCGDKKCTTMQLQTRSADEPMTIFVTCLTCHNTFTK